MDVHRSRFVPYPTSAISALAFSRSSDSGYLTALPALKLALGRADGSIEIWNPQNGLWVQETVFPGDNRSIDGLVWTQDPDELDAQGKRVSGQQRLFSIASSPSVTEWDLATGLPKRESTGNFSEVWCLTAQPRGKQKDGNEPTPTQEIVGGCGDGTIVLLSTADNDLQFKRFLARVGGKRARCMCVAYQNRERIAAGFADAMIRIYDTRNGSLLRSMSLGVSLPGMPKNPMVWQVRCLPNGDIVTGDSNGEVRFWDGKSYSLSQRIAGHDTDCLDLVTSSDGKTILSGSIDGKLAVYRQSGPGDSRKMWAKSSHRRVHNGEVKAIAAFDSKAMSIVVSGGSDVAPMITPLREYGKENLRSLAILPQEPPLVSAPRVRLMASWWGKTVYVWRMGRQAAVVDAGTPHNPRRLVAKLALDTQNNIRSVAISADGRLITVASSAEVKVFQLKRRAGSDSLAVRKLNVPRDLATAGARIVAFSPSGNWLAAVTPDSEVHVARIAPDSDQPKRLNVLDKVVELDRRSRKPATPSSIKAYDHAIHRIAFAPDSSVLVASDMSGYLDSWVLEGHEDPTAPAIDVSSHRSEQRSAAASDSDSDSSDSSDDDDATIIFYGQHWTDNPSGHLLPKLDSAPLVLTFRPAKHEVFTNGNPGIHATRHNPHAHSHELPQGQHRLFVMTAKHQMYELDVLAGRLSDWSRRNPTSVLPEDFKKIRDRVMGAVWDVDGEHDRLWLYGSSFVCMLNVGLDLAHDDETQEGAKRRRTSRDAEAKENPVDFAKRRKLESGAGGKIHHAGRNAGVADVIKRSDDGKTRLPLSNRQEEQTRTDDEEGDEDDDDDDFGLPLSLRRLQSNGDDERAVATTREKTPRERRWWCTFKYRPILGMVPISDNQRDGSLEVVIVERPVWDALADGKKRR